MVSAGSGFEVTASGAVDGEGFTLSASNDNTSPVTNFQASFDHLGTEARPYFLGTHRRMRKVACTVHFWTGRASGKECGGVKDRLTMENPRSTTLWRWCRPTHTRQCVRLEDV